MKRLLKSKAGVTVLEGVIALGLLALVTGGAFGVLLAASRQKTQPDTQEEMVWAVEKANTMLRAYAWNLPDTGLNGVKDHMPSTLQNGLCGAEQATPQIVDYTPVFTGLHDIECLLPPLCDKNNSSFTYTVSGDGNLYTITFDITCNGYTL